VLYGQCASGTSLLKIVSYNVCGIKKKLGDFYFFEFINSYDVIIILESFISEKDFDFITHKLSNKFRVNIKFAERTANYGRYMGGLIVLINLESPFLNIISVVEINDLFLVQINTGIDDKRLVLAPAYINCNFWESDFELFSNFLTDLGHDNLIMIGDLNGRVGGEQSVTEFSLSEINPMINDLRNSKDNTVNNRGRKILNLCENLGLIILNGRSAEDILGEYTFIGAMGSSVIDLAAVSINCLHFVEGFRVVCHSGSDHLPIEVCLKVMDSKTGRRACDQLLPLLPKLRWFSDKKQFYKARVERRVDGLELSENNQENVDNIIKIIIDSAHQKQSLKHNPNLIRKQKWFDHECLVVRKRKFKLLNQFRKTNCENIKLEYLAVCKQFKVLCRNKEKMYLERTIFDLFDNADAKRFWSALNSFKCGGVKIVGSIAPEAWVMHFKNLLNPPLLSTAISYAQPLITDEILDADFNMLELRNVLARLKDNKAPGQDRVPYEFFKNAPDSLLSKLLTVYNNMYNSGKVAQSFKNSIVFPLHKKGDVNLVQNYRGLSFIDCVSKIFSSLLNFRLNEWIVANNVISEYQAGFRKGYSTVDNIFNLACMVELRLAVKKQKLYCFFVDLTAAFDSIDRNSLIYKLFNLGVSSKFVKILQNLYEGTNVSVWCKNGLTNGFESKIGLKQGCVISPNLFSLFINDLPDFLEGGCFFGGRRVNILMYADDVVLLAPTATVLQQMISKLELYCDIWNLQVNLTKSNIMVFRRGGRLSRSDKWWYKGKLIDVVNSYKYLGVILTSTFSWDKHFDNKAVAAKLAINATWGNFLNNNKVSLESKFVCFNSIIRSILCYASQVWGYLHSDRVKSVQRVFIKRLFRLPNNTPNYFLYLETGLAELHSYTILMNLKYLIKVLCLGEDRLPNILAREVIRSKVFWYRDWKLLGDKFGLSVDFELGDDGALGHCYIF
jgi:hypothetical protein